MGTFDIAMEDGVVVFFTCCQGDEVFAGFGAELAEEFYLYVSVGCVQSQ